MLRGMVEHAQGGLGTPRHRRHTAVVRPNSPDGGSGKDRRCVGGRAQLWVPGHMERACRPASSAGAPLQAGAGPAAGARRRQFPPAPPARLTQRRPRAPAAPCCRDRLNGKLMLMIVLLAAAVVFSFAMFSSGGSMDEGDLMRGDDGST